MKIFLLSAACLMGLGLHATPPDSLRWIKKEGRLFFLNYTVTDSAGIAVIQKNLEMGNKTVTRFFRSKFSKSKFEVYIFPSRSELNMQWSKDWNIADFKSECWMVASGVAHRLDLLSPFCWKTDACDHDAGDRAELQKIITHELVHIFHAQHNPNADFDGMDDLSWLIEGLATFVSGQLTEERIHKVRLQLKEGNVPARLSQFWTGPDKYGRAGSFVEFLAMKYGRDKIVELLACTDLPSVLKTLKTDETNLINMWKTKMLE